MVTAAGMEKIGKLIREQDNRITDQPMFIVQQKRRICGMADGYADAYAWVHKDEGHEADEVLSARLTAKARDCRSTGKWEQIGYQDIWEFVTACFTEKGCDDFIAVNGHNLTEPRIYADGSYRNKEFRAVRGYLMGLPGPELAERDRLRVEVERLKGLLATGAGCERGYREHYVELLDKCEADRLAAITNMERLTAENAKLRAALTAYGRHGQHCRGVEHEDHMGHCDCGLARTLAEAVRG